ncbi:MAG: 50S ribosomal protein L10 [Desulfobacteraceae bacterium]
MLNLPQKKELVKRLNQEFSEAAIAILVDYKGLDVEKITRLRFEIRQQGAGMEVVKNTLLRRASEGTDAALLEPYYQGPSAVVISRDDPVAPAKALADFIKDNENLEIKAGVFNGKLVSVDEIQQLAKMPSREELLGKLVSTINQVPTSFVRVLNEVPRSMVNVLDAVREKKEAA